MPGILERQHFRPGELLKQGQNFGGGGNFKSKIKARPTLRPGKVNGANPGFIESLSKIGRHTLIGIPC